MKHLIIAFLFVGIAVFYFGCSDNSPSEPAFSQGDQVTTSFNKKPQTPFEGTSVTFNIVDWGKVTNWPKNEPYQRVQTRGLVVQTQDVISDSRVSGVVTWIVHMNQYFTDEGVFINDKRWGTGELIIPDVGRWDMTYKGWFIPGEGLTYEVDGHGKGELRGLKAHWTYFLENPPGVFTVTGFIVEK